MTVVSVLGLRCCVAWLLLMPAACRQTDVLGAAVSPRQPRDSTATSAPPVQPGKGEDTITVLVLPYENGCAGARYCASARVTSLTLDGGAPLTFSAPGPLQFPGIAPGRHVLRNISGHFGGPVICGFWFEDGSQEITLALQERTAVTVQLHFECY